MATFVCLFLPYNSALRIITHAVEMECLPSASQPRTLRYILESVPVSLLCVSGLVFTCQIYFYTSISELCMHRAGDSECLGQRRRTHRLTVQDLHSSTQYSLTRNTPLLIITGISAISATLKRLSTIFVFKQHRTLVLIQKTPKAMA